MYLERVDCEWHRWKQFVQVFKLIFLCALTFVFPLVCNIEYEFIHPDYRVTKGCFIYEGPSSYWEWWQLLLLFLPPCLFFLILDSISLLFLKSYWEVWNPVTAKILGYIPDNPGTLSTVTLGMNLHSCVFLKKDFPASVFVNRWCKWRLYSCYMEGENSVPDCSTWLHR